MPGRGHDVHTVKEPSGYWVNKQNHQQVGPHYSTQEAAIVAGRLLAIAARVDHVIHNHDGTIREKNSYGGDPFPPRG
jgi:hypothetical protein